MREGGWFVSGERGRYQPKKKLFRRFSVVFFNKSANFRNSRLDLTDSENECETPAKFGNTWEKSSKISAKFSNICQKLAKRTIV